MSVYRKFTRNLTKTVVASGVQFLITLLTTPIMTRLYEPSAYATFGILNTTATVMIGIGLLSLPNAYCAQKEESVRTDLLLTMLLLLVVLVMLAMATAAGMLVADHLQVGVHVSAVALCMLPLLVLTYGVRTIMVNMAIQRAHFGRLSLGQVVEPICSRGGSVALGAGFGGHPVFILVAVAAGHLTTIALLMRMLPRHALSQWRQVTGHIPKLRATLRQFADFAVFSTIAQQAQLVVMLGLQMGIAAFFSGHLAGQYILAVSILTLPVSLIALSTAPVVYHHFIETEKTNPSRLVRYFLTMTGLYLLVGIVVFAPIFFAGEALFSFAFGTIWAHAGKIAAMLSIAYVATFALTGVQSILMVTRRLKLQFMLELGTCIPALLAAIFCFKTMDFDRAIFYLSLIWLLRNGVLLCACLMAVLAHPHRRMIAL